MKTTSRLKDAATLERINLTFTNATSDAEIEERLTKVGLTAESIEEGKALLAAARKAYETANLRRRKRSVAYREFNTQK
nr:hypothetical protein [Bacteroidales bacterium]